MSLFIHNACSKALLGIKALYPLFDCVAKDSLIYSSMVCVISFWNLEFFLQFLKIHPFIGEKNLFNKIASMNRNFIGTSSFLFGFFIRFNRINHCFF